jgi:hypothetical protein
VQKNLDFYSAIAKGARKALSFPLLKILSHETALTNWTDIKKQVVWTAMSVAFFGSFRLGEILSENPTKFNSAETLMWSDVKFSEEVR